MSNKSCVKAIIKSCKLIKRIWIRIWGLFGTRQFGHLLLTIVALLAVNELTTLNKRLQLDSINKMNDRYHGLYEQFPKVFSQKEKDPEAKHNLARRYFNLWFDELSLCTDGYLPKGFMSVVSVGACVNLRKYPDLVNSYQYWKKLSAFSHTIQSERYIETIIDYAQNGSCDISTFKKINGCSVKWKE